MYKPYGSPGSLYERTNPTIYRAIAREKENWTPAQAEAFLGLEFPYSFQEFSDAMKEHFDILHMDDDETALYYALQDVIRENGEVWLMADDETWVAERYADVDDADEATSFLPLIQSLTYRAHATESEVGHVYDTGINGTMLNVTEEEMEQFIHDLAAHGPYAFILDERENGCHIYNIACVDTPYHLFYGIWNGPAFSGNAIVEERRAIDREGTGHIEYNIANTISIMTSMGFEYDEIEAFFAGNEYDYGPDAVSWYMVNHYFHQTGAKDCRVTDYWPFN